LAAGDNGDLPQKRFPRARSISRSQYVSCSERKRELRRRRHRRKKISIFGKKLEKATVSERTVIAEKLRALTPGGREIVARWELDKR
jgi:hypothetical protein